MAKVSLILLMVMVLVGFKPTTAVAATAATDHPGYLSDVSKERKNLAKEVVILPPDSDTGPSLRDQIFTEKVTKEFQVRYEERFGQTRTEQFISIPTRFFETQVQPGQYRTVEEEVTEQKNFGNFMMKRLVEVHLDNYMKENPNARPVYELKERLSNIDVQVRPGYKFKFKYSLSSNDLDLTLDNPKGIRNKLSFRMGSGFGPSSVDDTLLFLGYPLTKNIDVLSSYSLENQDYSISGVKRLNQYWSTSLTGSNNNIEGDKVVVGLSWRD